MVVSIVVAAFYLVWFVSGVSSLSAATLLYLKMPKPKIKTTEVLAHYTCQSPEARKWWKAWSNRIFRRMNKDADLRDAGLLPNKRPTRGYQD